MKDIEKILRQQVEAARTPSIQYLHFDKDHILEKYAFGLADVKARREATAATLYNGYSVTKTFTALAALQLAEQGKIEIDAPVRLYLPDFPYASDITVRHLLTHTAGIPNPIPLNWIHLAGEHSRFDEREFFKKIFKQHPKVKSRPNQKFAYTNLGYFILGQVIAQVAGVTYQQYVTDAIIRHIGVADNTLGFQVPDEKEYAKGYHKKSSFTNLVLRFLMDTSTFMGKAEGAWKPFERFYMNGPAYGGLIGTPDAFARYIQVLLTPGHMILSDPYKKMLFTEHHTADGKATGMCFSWFTGKLDGHTYYAHAGGGGGFYCEIRIYPEAGKGSVVFFNRTGMRDERFLDQVDRIN